MSNQKRRKDVRNIAIIAHVDHGKTTLVDAMLRQSGAYNFKDGESTIMDSNPLEKERGITIFSKNASFRYKDTQFNIVDTPGHADFGSEVERILKMVDGVLLLVDAFEGPMPQTKFVLRKSLEMHLKPIVVINKIDRPNARPLEVSDLTFDLFCELNATDEQLDFPIVFASGREGTAKLDLDDESKDLKPLLDTILHRVLPPVADPEKPFQMLVTMLDYDSYIGRIAIGRIAHGTATTGDQIALVKHDGSVLNGKIIKILKYVGLKRVEVGNAEAGDIVSIVPGIDDIKVGETLACTENPQALPTIKIDEPTISMNFSHNTSPIAGKDGGRFLTSRHIRERLEYEKMMNVGIKIEEVDNGDRFKVSGRGELHLAILIETMRREGYEFEVSRPKVILKKVEGETLEPVEEIYIEVGQEYQGAVIQNLGNRRAEMKDLQTTANTVRLRFLIASRALLGFRNEFMVMTRGSGIMYQNFFEYQKFKGELPSRQTGVLVSQNSGKAVAYALWGLQERGEIFIYPGVDVYEGMIIGVNNKGNDLIINAIREKKMSNMRSSGADEAIRLVPPREMTLEFALEFIEDDELVEITPKNVRLRKQYLDENERKIKSRKAAN
ncbi:MAG: translational GTPase TypA [bacterium]|nr:translational GTPase TypA [bacterium]